MRADETIRERRARLIGQVDAFLRRAADEGLLRADLPTGWASALLRQLLHLATAELPDLDAGQALVGGAPVETYPRGVGRG